MNKFDPEKFTLSNGKHEKIEDGVCLLEAVSWFSGGAFTDRPSCVGDVLAAYVRNINDFMKDNATRNKYLIPLIPLLIGTNGTKALEQRRLFTIVDFTVQTLLPMVLNEINHSEYAENLRRLEPITDKSSAYTATDAARAAYGAPYAAADVAKHTECVLGADTVWTMVVGLIERLCAMKDCD